MNHGTVTNKKYDIDLGVALGMQILSETPVISNRARIYILEIDGEDYFIKKEIWQKFAVGDKVSFETEDYQLTKIEKK